MKVLGIIQARMGSKRLPGKMLMPIIDGKGALELMIERVSHSSKIDKLTVATTIDKSDDNIELLCQRLSIPCFRGSIEDVLDRFYRAASLYPEYDIIVRLTGDCPLHDPGVIDDVISEFCKNRSDYTSNVAPPTYPDGLDVEVFSKNTLDEVWNQAEMQSSREHVTLFIRSNPQLFKIANYENPNGNLSEMRWTLDEKADFEFISAVFAELYHLNPNFKMKDIVKFIKKSPKISSLNRGIERNEGLRKSLNEENL